MTTIAIDSAKPMAVAPIPDATCIPPDIAGNPDATVPPDTTAPPDATNAPDATAPPDAAAAPGVIDQKMFAIYSMLVIIKL